MTRLQLLREDLEEALDVYQLAAETAYRRLNAKWKTEVDAIVENHGYTFAEAVRLVCNDPTFSWTGKVKA